MLKPPDLEPGLLHGLLDRESAVLIFRTLAQHADARGIGLRPPPPEPTTCCGRGCNGCVWEGYFDAATFWREDAIQALTAANA